MDGSQTLTHLESAGLGIVGFEAEASFPGPEGSDHQIFAKALIHTDPAKRAERMRKWLVMAAYNYRVAAGAERAVEELSELLEKAQEQADEEAA